MHVAFVDLSAQYRAVQSQVDAAIQAIIQRGDYILGQAVHNLEEAFAAYCEASHAIGVDSGFSALELILRACDIGPGDEVILPANTFIATALAVASCGARPVLVDIDPHTYNIDVAQVEAAITPSTRAIIAVHLYGQPADMHRLTELARHRELRLFEDACQAHGARYRSRRVGGLADAAAFSFYPAKNLGAYGDGGAVVTNDDELAAQVRLLRNLGQQTKNVHAVKGYNHRLDTMQAAIVNAQLPTLDMWNAARRTAAELYTRLLAPLPIITPTVASDAEHVYHLYIVRVNEREDLCAYLQRHGISTGIHYPTPIHQQPAFHDLGYQLGDFPISEKFAGEILSLPMHPHLSREEVEYVTATMADYYVNRSQNGNRPQNAPATHLSGGG
jgi:dTDP-4-amino-4,6-dideoxygalactose transaminase